MGVSEHVRCNQAYWDAQSDAYQERHAAFIGRPEPRWGVWQLPEHDLGILGNVAGKDVLEFGCGAAQWSIVLTRRGARAVALHLSGRQLRHARRLMAEAGVSLPLVAGSAEDVPLRDESFDLVFCDYGAMTFTDPYRSVPEVARLLRPDGLFAFSHVSPVLDLCWPEDEKHPGQTLVNDYFGLRRVQDTDGTVSFQLPYGDWIRLFRRHGLLVEDLVEPRPPAGASSTYRDEVHLAWSRRWPAECIWKLRKGD